MRLGARALLTFAVVAAAEQLGAAAEQLGDFGSGDCPTSIFTTAAACSDSQVLVTSGQQVGTCTPGTQVLSSDGPFDILNPPSLDNGPYLIARVGGKGYTRINGEMKRCELGYYCPFNETTGFYSDRIKCPGGNHFCWIGAIEPFECSGFSRCTGGAMRAGPGGLALGIILVIILVALAVCSAMCVAAVEHRMQP